MRYLISLVLVMIVFISGCKNNSESSLEDSGFTALNKVSFKNTAINSIAVDKTGKKWVATANGLYVFTNTKWYEYTALINKAVQYVTVANDSILVAFSDGAYTLKIEPDSISLLEKITSIQIKSDTVSMNIYGIGLRGRKWIGSPDGLSFFNGQNWKHNEGIIKGIGGIIDVRCMAFRKTDCFFGTFGMYLWHFSFDKPNTPDAVTGASYMLGSQNDTAASFNGRLTSDTIFCVYASKDTSIWFGSPYGLTRNKGNTKKDKGLFEYFLEGQPVYSVIEASDNKIVAGTGSGIYIKSGNEWTNYNVTNNLAGNKVTCIAEDKDKSLWLGTDKGISHFRGGTVSNY